MPGCCAAGAERAGSGWPSSARFDVKRRLRVRRRSDFQRTINGRRFHSGRALVGFAVPSDREATRVGVTVSRGIRTAADRNRARRRLREAARQKLLSPDSPLSQVGIRYDVILIARPPALEVSFADLTAEASQAALRLSMIKP